MKQLLLVAVLLLCLLQKNYSQKKTACPGKEHMQVVHKTTADSFTMEYPLDMCCSYVQYHYGKNAFKSNKIFFFNDGVSFTTLLNNPVFCNISKGVIKSVWKEDGAYTLFLEKDNFLVVLHNLKTINVKKGDIVTLGQKLGIIGSDESDPDKGLLELLLFKGTKIINPEKYLQLKNKPEIALLNKK